MSRRGLHKTTSVQLFPFLAVLICTMGALVVLLVVIARQAALQGAADAQVPEFPSAASQSASEDAEWQISILKQSRDKTAAELVDGRAELSHIEDHLRRLRQQLAKLRNASRQFADLSQGKRQERQAAAGELEALRQEMLLSEESLKQALAEAAHRANSYAVVPYEGPNQTRRRPIYIECHPEGITLRPEGIELGESDFEGPLGPGNPLAAAVRAQCEYLKTQDPQGGEPYPLLLVRPDGIAAYYAARTALKSWGEEFGYELVGQDWKLDYPRPIQPLAEVTQQVVAEARIRQLQAIRAAPRHYAQRERHSFRTPENRGDPASANQPAWAAQGGRGRGGYGSFGGSTGGLDDGESSGVEGHIAQDGPLTRNGSGGFQSSEEGNPGASKSGPRHVASGSENSTSADGSDGTDARRAGAGTDDPFGAVGLVGAARSAQSADSGAPSLDADPTSGHSRDQGAKSHKKVTSLAKTRGRGWGLPETAQRSTPVTRPVFIVCRPDKLVLLGDDGTTLTKEIPLGARTQDSVDDLVGSVWQHIKSWGIAGRGLYWRPELLVTVTPGSADRYAELKALLTDSGLEVQERNAAPTANSPSTMKR